RRSWFAPQGNGQTARLDYDLVMRNSSTLPVGLLLAIGLVGCPASKEGASQSAHADSEAPIVSKTVAPTLLPFHDALLDAKREALLYRALGHEGQVWDS